MPETDQAHFDAPIFRALLSFLRAHWARVLIISALVLIPCFWHHEIACSDLGSHLYNAWLVQLIQRGQAPGLYLSGQHTNVLFDWLLGGLSSIFDLRISEKIAVSLAVLIFFWGAFALASAAARRAPWFIVPVILLVTYGWTFHLGLFNYYLSLGLSSFCLAILWRGKGWELLAALAIAPLVVFAHVLGFFWLIAAAAYIGFHENVRGWDKVLPLLFAMTTLFALHLFFSRRYIITPGTPPFFSFNGADQLVLFGERYRMLARALLIFAIVSLCADAFRRRHEQGLWRDYAVPLQLYAMVWVAVFWLPEGVQFPPPKVGIALLTERLTSVSAVLGCCLLGAMRPRKWHLAASAAIAAIFFIFDYQDTAVVNRMEAQAVHLVSTLPPNQRVMATILPLKGSRILIQHIIDRACIGRCFSYGNYEPGTGLFRVRALPGNPYVVSTYDEAIDMEHGGYIVQPRDLPLYQVYQCGAAGTELCIASLKAGEANDDLGEHAEQQR
ncbi:MAG TPA: hypothetical protein VEJ38_01800 [Candidatus Acidoferrales bacterium]|nr:hypothetical protein [Candidatus Acidoferrales bacterium]